MIANLCYLVPLAFLALLPLGASLGGLWTFLPAVAVPVLLVVLDKGIGDAPTRELRDGAHLSRWLPRLYIALQLAATAWLATRVARGLPVIEIVGLVASTGVTTGVFGFLAAHEMIHSHERGELALGMTFLASAFYMHFHIAHLFGHHRRAATYDDPVSARLGESLYAFVLRSVPGQVREAWAHECERLRRARAPAYSFRNRLILYFAVEIAMAAGLALVSVPALAFVLCVAAIAVGLLEAFNYVAHYGILRRRGADGGFEPLMPEHSWNSSNWMNNSALFNMGRHSDHHVHPVRSFEQLEPIADEAELPSGYAAAILTALVPPLWRRVMDPRAKAVANARMH